MKHIECAFSCNACAVSLVAVSATVTTGLSTTSVSPALALSLDPRQVAHLIADNVLALLGARDVTPFEVQPRTGNLVSVACAGEGAAGLSQPMVMPPGVGASGLAVATRREVF